MRAGWMALGAVALLAAGAPAGAPEPKGEPRPYARGPHGGVLKRAGPVQVELAIEGAGVRAYFLDAEGNPRAPAEPPPVVLWQGAGEPARQIEMRAAGAGDPPPAAAAPRLEGSLGAPPAAAWKASLEVPAGEKSVSLLFKSAELLVVAGRAADAEKEGERVFRMTQALVRNPRQEVTETVRPGETGAGTIWCPEDFAYIRGVISDYLPTLPAGTDTPPAAAHPPAGKAGPPRAGDPAPDFTLPSDEGKTVSLGGYRGKYVVLYFYPRADTGG